MTNSHPRIPSATYRLQFHADFTFRDATEILDYLQDLGISDVYASPFFQASADSTHGYDVANHNRLSPVVGGEAEFRKFVSELRRRDMGLVLDFVPNHMGISESLNAWWMDVLEDGPGSRFAHYFDIDWSPRKEALSEKVSLPILGDRYGVILESGDLRLSFEKGAFFLHYFETKLPINWISAGTILSSACQALDGEDSQSLQEVVKRMGSADKADEKRGLQELAEERPKVKQAIDQVLRRLEGTAGVPASFDSLHALLENQAYRLSYWRVAAEEINYRRFFDINTLAAIRVEVPEVFEAAHQLVFELLARGDVTGLRIDHVDGLWNPLEYLTRLQERYAKLVGVDSARMYLVVEKILEASHEELPLDWPVDGTTGYEFANHLVHVLTDSSAAERLTRTYQKFAGNTDRFADLVYEKKLFVMEFSFASEIASLGRELDQLSELHRHFRDFTINVLTKAVREVIACFPVYRTYATPERALSERDERVILRAVSLARRRNPTIDKPVFDFLRNLLLLRFPDGLTDELREKHLHFVMKFQQCTGPVMAKGLEDTVLYLYHRLDALNEVGGNPGAVGLSVEEFHRLNGERQKHFPNCMLASSTHDTKRSEDVRMRMAAISEIPEDWRKAVQRWSRMNRRFRTVFEEDIAPSTNEEYLLYQTLVGSWPAGGLTAENRSDFTARIQAYMLKAVKEGKANSSWTEPNEDWEKALTTFIAKILDEKSGAAFQMDVAPIAATLCRIGAWNSLSEVVLKCTSPGVPDIYQGTEIWDLSLVDPDNRRPVNYLQRRELLAASTGPGLDLKEEDWTTGRVKLLLTQRLLRFRREYAALFREADYEPLEVRGARADHLIAFSRRGQEGQLIVMVPRLTNRLGETPLGSVWIDTVLPSISGEWRDVLSGEAFVANDGIVLAERFEKLPLAVWFQTAT